MTQLSRVKINGNTTTKNMIWVRGPLVPLMLLMPGARPCVFVCVIICQTSVFISEFVYVMVFTQQAQVKTTNVNQDNLSRVCVPTAGSLFTLMCFLTSFLSTSLTRWIYLDKHTPEHQFQKQAINGEVAHTQHLSAYREQKAHRNGHDTSSKPSINLINSILVFNRIQYMMSCNPCSFPRSVLITRPRCFKIAP